MRESAPLDDSPSAFLLPRHEAVLNLKSRFTALIHIVAIFSSRKRSVARESNRNLFFFASFNHLKFNIFFMKKI